MDESESWVLHATAAFFQLDEEERRLVRERLAGGTAAPPSREAERRLRRALERLRHLLG